MIHKTVIPNAKFPYWIPDLIKQKIVGAVTHVLANDSTTGYGIFVENMLYAAG